MTPGGGVTLVDDRLEPGDVFGALSHRLNPRGMGRRVPPTFRPRNPPAGCLLTRHTPRQNGAFPRDQTSSAGGRRCRRPSTHRRLAGGLRGPPPPRLPGGPPGELRPAPTFLGRDRPYSRWAWGFLRRRHRRRGGRVRARWGEP